MILHENHRSSPSLVEILDLEFGYPRRHLYRSLNLSVPRNEVTVIMGPSGCGKSTLLGLIGGRLQPQAGDVRFQGISIPPLRQRELYRLRRRMGMMFQHNALLTDLNVFENVAFPIRENTVLPESLIRKLVILKLQMVGLRGAAYLEPVELSGGMARRVALARAIALDPDFVMYDEPFTGLDEMAIVALTDRLLDLKRSGCMVLVATHDLDIADGFVDRSVMLRNGKMVELDGKFGPLRERYRVALVQDN